MNVFFANPRHALRRLALLLTTLIYGLALGQTPAPAEGDSVDLGAQVPSAEAIAEGLFPDDKCKELEALGFKCMGFKPAIRYSLLGKGTDPALLITEGVGANAPKNPSNPQAAENRRVEIGRK